MSRKLEQEYLLPGAPEDVWRFLTEAEGITRWLAPTARVEPGEGGKMFISWGPGMEGEGTIHLWEPNRAMGWTEKGSHPKLVEFFLEGEGGQTRLRLVQSGFGDGAEFDDEFDAVNGGWRTFFGTMAHALSHHGFASCRQVTEFVMSKHTRSDAIAKASERMGFVVPLSNLAVGATYAAHLPELGLIEGRRLDPDKPGYFLLTIDNWNRSSLALFFEAFGDSLAVTQQWFLYGAAQVHEAELRKQLSSWLANVSA